MSVQGMPFGGVQTIRQSVATIPLTFHGRQNGRTIAVALLSTRTGWGPVVKESAASTVSQRRSGHIGGPLTAHLGNSPRESRVRRTMRAYAGVRGNRGIPPSILQTGQL